MHLILYVFLIVIMSYFIMYFVSDDKNKGDQSVLFVSFFPYTYSFGNISPWQNVMDGESYSICAINAVCHEYIKQLGQTHK